MVPLHAKAPVLCAYALQEQVALACGPQRERATYYIYRSSKPCSEPEPDHYEPQPTLLKVPCRGISYKAVGPILFLHSFSAGLPATLTHTSKQEGTTQELNIRSSCTPLNPQNGVPRVHGLTHRGMLVILEGLSMRKPQLRVLGQPRKGLDPGPLRRPLGTRRLH